MSLSPPVKARQTPTPLDGMPDTKCAMRTAIVYNVPAVCDMFSTATRAIERVPVCGVKEGARGDAETCSRYTCCRVSLLAGATVAPRRGRNGEAADGTCRYVPPVRYLAARCSRRTHPVQASRKSYVPFRRSSGVPRNHPGGYKVFNLLYGG